MSLALDALLFDLDGTLVDSRRDLASSVHHLQKTLGFRQSSEEQVAAFVGDGMLRLVQRAVPGLPEKRLPEAVRIFIRHYHQHCLDHTRPYPGVSEMLERFRHKKMAVVTNKPTRVSRRILEGLGLLARFDRIIGGDFLRRKKPDPEPVLHALALMKTPSPRSAVMIGDGINDILSGRSAGAYTCGIRSNISDWRQIVESGPDFLALNAYDLMHLFS